MSEVGSPFDWINAISEGRDLFLEGREDYPVPLVNKAYSLHLDTIWDAQMMNTLYGLPPKIQNAYFLNTIERKRRYIGKWPKAVDDEVIMHLQTAFNYSLPRAVEAAKLLTDEQVKQLNEHITKHKKSRTSKAR